MDSPKSTGSAVLLSFFFSGAGHLYVGKAEKGIIWRIIYIVLCGFEETDKISSAGPTRCILVRHFCI